MVNIDPDKFRPLGKRVLVRRYSLPEQSAGGIYVLGRDYPTMGKVLRTSRADAHFEEVQWEIKADFDSRIIGPDLLLLELDDINLWFSEGRAYAANDRVLINNDSSLEHNFLALSHKILTKFSLGRVESIGTILPQIYRDDCVMFDRSFASEIYLNNKRHLIVRYEHCVAVVEDDNKCD